jgi:predicted ester cyclase
MIAEADKVVVRFTFRATYGGGFMSIPATGQKIARPGLIIYRIADAKSMKHWMEVDPVADLQLQMRRPEGRISLPALQPAFP